MDRAISQFESNLASAKELGVIFGAFDGKVTGAISMHEMLRAEIVLAVSSLDCYVHDVVRIGMTKAFAQSSSQANAFLNFSVSMQFVERILRAPTPNDRASLLDQEIRRLHGYKTFQNADSISQALSLLGLQGIWDSVGRSLGMPTHDVKTRLNLIIERRNKIAHEGDIDPAMGIGLKYPIDLPLVSDAVSFLESLVKSLHNAIVGAVTF